MSDAARREQPPPPTTRRKKLLSLDNPYVVPVFITGILLVGHLTFGILEGYDKMVDSDNFVVLDGTLPVNKLQKQMRDIVASKIDLKRFAPHAPETE